MGSSTQQLSVPLPPVASLESRSSIMIMMIGAVMMLMMMEAVMMMVMVMVMVMIMVMRMVMNNQPIIC